MLKNILEATKNFCIHQIGQECDFGDILSKNRTLIAYIDIHRENGDKYRVFVAPEESFAQKISQIFLEEDQSDEDTLKDITLETANLIVGSAKVISESEDNIQFTIGTPYFEKIDIFDFDYDQAKSVILDECTLILAIKELYE